MFPTSGRVLARPLIALALVGGLAASALAAPMTFRAALSYDAGGFLQFTVAGDFDGDHSPDIAGTRTDGSVLWWHNAHGVLGSPQTIAVPFPIHGLAAGDLNGDGLADLVGCDAAAPNGALAILLSNGAGFDPAIVVPTDSAGVVAVTLADLDGDGHLDIVAANRVTRMVHRLFNDGTGHFSGLASTRIPGEVSRTWVADLDRDGHPDILTGLWPQFMLSGAFGRASSAGFTLFGTGGGAFAAPVPAKVRGVMALGAFSGLGAHDAMVYDSAGVGIARDLGDGTFAAPFFTPGAWTNCGDPFAAPIDLDGDGRDELIGSITDSCPLSNFGVFRVNGALALTHREVCSGYYGLAPVVADLDGDGHLDAVLSGLLVCLNRDGRLGDTRNLATSRAGVNDDDIQDAHAADLNGDGAADVLVSRRIGEGNLFLSNHDGTFQNPVGWQANSYIRGTAVVDLDGDGHLDVLEWHNDPGFTNHLYSALGDGVGHFGPANTLSLSTTGLGLIAADFDGDGHPDALIGTYIGVRLLCLNDGHGNFTQQTCSLPLSGTYSHVDGDLLPGHFTTSGNSLSLEHATAVGALGPPVLTPIGATLTSALFADVNGDGLTDAVCLVNGAQVETFLGASGGAWSAPIVSPESPIAPGYAPVFANIGDLDGDGRPDLLFTGAGVPAAISVLRNLGGGVFGERGDTFTTTLVPTGIADVDGDGVGDLVGISRFPGQGGTISSVDVLFGAGAAGVPTPALVSLVSATATLDRAKLSWFVPSDGPATLTVERRRDAGAWSAIASVTPAGGLATYEDRAVEPGASYSWRLAWSEGGATKHSDLASLTIPARLGFAIQNVRPNPSDGERVWVTLAVDRAAPLELALVDVAGRVVATRRVESATPGSLTLALETPGLRVGIYFVRATQNARHASATLVRLR